jgi:hypothetical protein
MLRIGTPPGYPDREHVEVWDTSPVSGIMTAVNSAAAEHLRVICNGAHHNQRAAQRRALDT